MGDRSKIEWTDATWNPIRARNRETGNVGHFCARISPGCINCYAEGMQRRFGNPIRYAAQDIDKVELFLDEDVLTQPLRWKRPRMVFVCSMTDLFLEHVPGWWLDRIFAALAMAPRHTFQILTKRPERMHAYVTDQSMARSDGRGNAALALGWGGPLELLGASWPPKNVWLGVSVEDRARKDRIDKLRETPAAVRFLSVEPLLEDLGDLDLSGIHWVIVGGESGPNARPMHPAWARSIREQCDRNGIPLFFKQWGGWAPSTIEKAITDRNRGRYMLPDGSNPVPSERISLAELDRAVRQPGAVYMAYVGKKRAGRLLDGREHSEVPHHG